MNARIATNLGPLGYAPIPTDGYPIIVERGFGDVWTACLYGPSVLRFDGETGALKARISTGVGSLPFGVLPALGRVWFTDQNPIGNGVLRSIDPATNTVDPGSIATGSARGIVADATRLWLGNHFANTAVAVDPIARTVVKSIPVGVWPFARLGFDGRRIYVPCYVGDGVWVIDTQNGDAVSQIAFDPGSNPWSAAPNPANDTVWCVGYSDALVRGINVATQTVTRIFGLPGTNPGGHDVKQIGNLLLVTLSSINQIAVLDLNSNGALIDTISTSLDPAGLCVDDRSFWVACAQSNQLERRLIHSY